LNARATSGSLLGKRKKKLKSSQTKRKHTKPSVRRCGDGQKNRNKLTLQNGEDA